MAAHATKKDVALLISYSGTTAEVINEAKTFKKSGTPIISITANKHSPLARLSNLILPLPYGENSDMKISNFSSQLAIEYVLNTLYSCIFACNYKTNQIQQRDASRNYLHF